MNLRTETEPRRSGEGEGDARDGGKCAQILAADTKLPEGHPRQKEK